MARHSNGYLLVVIAIVIAAPSCGRERSQQAPAVDLAPTLQRAETPVASTPVAASSSRAAPPAAGLRGQSTSVSIAVGPGAVYVAPNLEIGELEAFDRTTGARTSLGRHRKVGSIAVVSDVVYFTRDESHVEVGRSDLMRVAANGGRAEQIRLRAGTPTAVVAGGDRLFVLIEAGGASGSRLVELLPDGRELPKANVKGRFAGAQFSDGSLYWIDEPKILRLGPNDRAGRVIASGKGEWVDFHVSSTALLWLDKLEPNGRLMHTPLTGGATRELSADLRDPDAVCVSGQEYAFTVVTAEYERALYRGSVGGTFRRVAERIPAGTNVVCDGLRMFWVAGREVLALDASASAPTVRVLGRRTP